MSEFLTPHHDHDPRAFDALIFDCDGTLGDTMPAHFVAWKQTMDAIGVEFTEQRFYELAGVPAVDIIEMFAEEYDLAVDAEAVAHRKEELFADAIPNVKPVEKVVAIVTEMHGKLPLGVGSGSPRWSVEAVVSQLDLSDRFDAMVCAGEVPNPKPAPDVFAECARALGVAPGRCCVYEDGDLGLQAAKAAGMTAIDVRPWY